MPAMTKRLAVSSCLVLSSIVFFIYVSSLATGFFADDYNFLEPVARLDPLDYFMRYFDPRLQTMWYRPLQGVQIWIEWQLFGANATGYHLVNILFHAINASLLFALVWRIVRKWRVAFAAAFFYATMPVYALAINWINITDPLATIFYLAGIWTWWSFRHTGKPRDFALTLGAYTVALLIKQMAITLPAVLILLDYLLIQPQVLAALIPNPRRLPAALGELARRYGAFALVAAIFLTIQYSTRSTHTFATVFGYSLGAQIISILIQYLSLLVFPYGYFLPTDTQFTEGMPFSDERNLLWLALALGLYLCVTWRTRSRGLILLGLALLVTLAPVLPFPFIELRYLYLPAMCVGIVLALWLDHALTLLREPRAASVVIGVAGALITLGCAFSIANANAEIFEFARQRRVPFRDISRAHPTFPDQTRLYFIDSISPPSELSGMFTLRYGRGVTLGANELWHDSIARWREHPTAFVYYFDATGKPIEVAVEPTITARALAPLPITFAAPLRLEGFELARETVARGNVVIVLTYWRATGKPAADYTFFAHLVDTSGRNVAGVDTPPRKGKAPTTQWLADQTHVEAFVIPVPREATPGAYRLELGMYESATQQRLAITDARGQPAGTALVIAPLQVVEKE